jgi:hypothetical protein
MGENEKSLEERFEQHFKARERLDKRFWAKTEELNDEYDALMKELNES